MEESIKEIIADYNSYLEKIPYGCEVISERLRENRVSEALLDISNFSEGMLWLNEISKLFISNNILVKMDFEKMKEFLIEINEGLNMEDYVIVADIFEYEIKELFNTNKNEWQIEVNDFSNN